MNCPRTGKELKPVLVDGIEIDLSMGCGGVWFDQFELNKFDEVHESAGEILIEHINAYHKPLNDLEVRLKCPKDPDVVMMRRFYSGKLQIEIDECPQCGGIWLDSEELSGIRKLFPTEEHLNSANNKFIEEVMASSEIRALESKSQDLPDKLNKITNILSSILRLGI